MKVTKKRAKLLAELEAIIGHETYNANIQNWGAGGAFLGEGRAFRYPLSYISDGEKTKGHEYFGDIPPEVLMTGHYRFGANQLSVMRALDEVVRRLEEKYGFRV